MNVKILIDHNNDTIEIEGVRTSIRNLSTKKLEELFDSIFGIAGFLKEGSYVTIESIDEDKRSIVEY